LPHDRYKDTVARQRFYDQLLPRLQTLPGVSHAAIVSNLPGLGAAHRDIEIEQAFISPGSARPQASIIVQSPGYLDVIHLPLLLGRDFNASDGTAGHKAAIVTLQCARHFWPGQTAIGRRFRFYDDKKVPGDWITVVGVAADMTQELHEKKPNPLLFLPFQQEGWDGMALLVESSINVDTALRPTVATLDPDLPLREVSNLSEEIAHQEWFIQLLTIVFLSFALIALIMASVGLYAVIATPQQAAPRRLACGWPWEQTLAISCSWSCAVGSGRSPPGWSLASLRPFPSRGSCPACLSASHPLTRTFSSSSLRCSPPSACSPAGYPHAALPLSTP
jgi:putative ABC transport system permease protein